jgi:hypothetical protein
VRGSQSLSHIVDNSRPSVHAGWDQFRDRGLSILLLLEVCLIFFATPLAAKGLRIAGPILELTFLAVILVVVMLSRRRGAIALILLGVATIAAGLSLGSAWSSVTGHVLRRSGDILTLSALTWVISEAVYAPGRITFHRLQGAVVLYLNAAAIFAAVFSLISTLNPAAFVNLPGASSDLGELATMLYFSLTTLTTTGYGDIVPVDPFARSFANLEAVTGAFYLAITVARLVTLELEDRRSSSGRD